MTVLCKAKPPREVRAEKPVEIIQGFWGPLNGEHQSTPRAELEAIAIVLEHADPPICIVTDHQNHVKAFKKGRRHCCKITSPMLDIWLRIWNQVDRLGHPNVRMRWVPSHQQAHDNETWQQRVDRRVNQAADNYADRGGNVHDLPKETAKEVKNAEKLLPST